MKNFKELVVWQKAHRMTLDLYGATRTFPKEELYGLTSQIRRSAASIGANISQKDRVGGPTMKFAGSCKSRAALQVKPNTTYFSLVTWNFCGERIFIDYRSRRTRFSAC